jgi:shikimate kinase
MSGRKINLFYDKFVFLTGFMGVGKSTVGKILAQKLDRGFRDLDQCIEEQVGLCVADIFKVHGEDFFREKESQVLSQVLSESVQVIALGGGTFLRESHRQALKEKGMTIYLQASVSTLHQRLKGQNLSLRPLLQVGDETQQMEQMECLLRGRERIYEEAQCKIITDGQSADEVAAEIYEWMKDLEEKGVSFA